MFINFFLGQALSGEPLTVYEPGDQARNYVHVEDVARAYVRSCERLLDQLAAGQTGVESYEIASDEDPGITTVAETVQAVTAEETGTEVPVELVENPRDGETLVSEFAVNTSAARERLNWEAEHTIEASVRELVRARTECGPTG